MKEVPNLNYINEISKGNMVFVTTIIGIIKKELTEEIKTYQLHLKKGNHAKTSRAVHKISHKIRILGLNKGCAIADSYSTDLLESNLKLKLDFESILTTLQRFIKKI